MLWAKTAIADPAKMQALFKVALCASLALHAQDALAHVSERALVMLLPTDIYISAGMAAFVATIVLLTFLPARIVDRFFAIVPIGIGPIPGALITSLTSTLILFCAILAGLFGSRDPLANPLTLLVWTFLWIALPLLIAAFGNLWRYLNPWTGLLRILRARPILTYPTRLGAWPACLGLVLFALFMVADIAPADPSRLAVAVGAFWLWGFVGALLFGRRWLVSAEPFTCLLRLTRKLAPFWQNGGAVPGSRLVMLTPQRGVGLLALLWLGIGSFDGLNETFWWLAKIGINPLAFPGRSAVMFPNAIGLIGALIFLGAIFIVTTKLGLLLAKSNARLKDLAPRLMLTFLPIALGYHLAHYLTQLMVNGQYLLVALSDPMGTGADFLGLGPHFVSTGFFNRPETVRNIWLTQAGAVVLGHCLAVVMAHKIASDFFETRLQAFVSQLPIALFMVAYTFFGLWLLAQPTGS